jgi:GntR family transcriptional regulator, transcriptional repressor for pyruvate dehydrogenase complex
MDKRLGSSGRAAGSIAPISVPKASDILADQLRDLILNGAIPAGGALPPERELVVSSGLSRSSVRDALRVLEVEGLIVTKPGRSGGSIVRLPGRETVARPLELYVKSHEIQLQSLLDCRLAVEPFLASRAAQNHTDEDLALIKDIHAQFVATTDNVADYKRLNLEWHLAIAQASKNELLIALMEAISQPILEADGYHQVTTEAIRAEAKKAHAAILDAIENRNAEQAHSRMARHLGAYIEVAQAVVLKP